MSDPYRTIGGAVGRMCLLALTGVMLIGLAGFVLWIVGQATEL